MPTTCHCAVAQSVERPSLMGVQIMPWHKVVGKNHRNEILAAPSVNSGNKCDDSDLVLRSLFPVPDLDPLPVLSGSHHVAEVHLHRLRLWLRR